MGRWVTLEDDQHVYISDGGKVLATRGAISSAGGGKERGRALAARSKAAMGKATDRTTRAIEHAQAAARPRLREQADKHRAAKGTLQERTKAIVDKANKRFSKAEKTQNAIKVHVAASSRFGDIEQVNKLVAKSAPYTRTKNRLMGHKTTIERLIKEARYTRRAR